MFKDINTITKFFGAGKILSFTLTKYSALMSKDFYSLQKALPLLQDRGSIILTGSIGAYKGMKALSVYSATKVSIRSFALTQTVDLKQRKIRVNALNPGPIDTLGVDGLAQSEEEIEQLKKSLITAIPMGRMDSPYEVAKVVSLLASDENSFVTGIELSVDGGMAQI